jgi:tetratricopeptide (TPR) repeat protein
MKPSLALFELIQTLEPGEVDAIRRGARVHVKGGENKYVFLFDEILKQEEYDEKSLIKKLGYEKELNKFAFFKNYLYNYILKCLEDRPGFIKREIRNGLNRVEVLVAKKLLPLAEEEISKVEALCRRYQVLQLWIIVNEMKLEILKIRRKKGEDVSGKLTEIKQDLGKLIKARRTLIFYRKLFSLVRKKHHYSSFFKELEEHEEFKNVMQSELMENDPGLNFFHKNYFLFSKGIYYYAAGDYKKATIIAIEMLKLWEANKEMNKVFFGAFYNTYYNKALNEMKRGEYKSAIVTCQALMKELDVLHKGNTFDRYMLYNLMVDIYNNCGYFDKGVELVREYKEAREKLRRSIHRAQAEQLYHYNLASAYFGVGDFKQANKHINEIINNEIDYTNDLTCLAYFLSLIIHLELGNTELLPYRIKSVQRYLSKKDGLLNIKMLFIDFLKQLVKSKSSVSLKSEYRELRNKMEDTLEKFPIERKLIDMFDLLSWIDGKIEGQPFMEVRKRKMKFALD